MQFHSFLFKTSQDVIQRQISLHLKPQPQKYKNRLSVFLFFNYYSRSMGGCVSPLPWVVISISEVLFYFLFSQSSCLPLHLADYKPWTKAIWLGSNLDKVGKEESSEQMSKSVAAPSVNNACLQAVKLACNGLKLFAIIIFLLLEVFLFNTCGDFYLINMFLKGRFKPQLSALMAFCGQYTSRKRLD